MNPLPKPFLSLSFIIPAYTGPLPEFDPADVVEGELADEVDTQDTQPVEDDKSGEKE